MNDKKRLTALIMVTLLSTLSYGEERYSAPINNLLSISESTFIPSRVIGGEIVVEQDYPWQVGLYCSNKPTTLLCGGAVIDKKWVLTAAHCIDECTTANHISVYMGSNNLNFGGNSIKVKRIIKHENYDSRTLYNDIALLELVTEATVTPINPLSKSQETLSAPGVLATVTGWGVTSEGGKTQPYLMEVGVKIVSNQECNRPLSYAGKITPSMMCAGFREGGKDSCQGDSGGPLVVPDKKGSYLLSGIVSGGEGCAKPNKYGVYTRVSKYDEWINNNL